MIRNRGWRAASRAAMAATALLAVSVGGGLVPGPAAGAVPVTAAATPAPTGGLNGVYCLAPRNCLATGYRLVGPPYGGVVLHWNGTRWAYESVPYPYGSKDSSLTTIACFGSKSCLAEGHYGSNPSETSSYFDRYDGTHWTLTLSRQPKGYTAGATSCFGKDACWALAVRHKKASRIEKWKNTAWDLSAPLPANTGAAHVQLQSLTCLSGTECTAVGSDIVNSSGARQVLIDRLQGTKWSAVTTPVPTGAAAPQLNGVTCRETTACQAVGGRSIGSKGGPGLIERWNGSTWSITSNPASANAARFQFAGVTCRTVSSCQAWGLGAGGAEFAGWNGSRWTSERQSSALDDFAPADVSCATTRHCIAVGQSVSGTKRLAAAAFDGGSWTSLTVPATDS